MSVGADCISDKAKGKGTNAQPDVPGKFADVGRLEL